MVKILSFAKAKPGANILEYTKAVIGSNLVAVAIVLGIGASLSALNVIRIVIFIASYL